MRVDRRGRSGVACWLGAGADMTARAGAGSPLEATGSGDAGSRSSAPAGGYAAGSLRSRFVSGTPDRDIVFRRSACSEPTAVIASSRSGAPRLRNKRLPSGAGAGADEASTGSPTAGASDAAPPDAASEGALTGSGGSASASGLGCGGLGCGGPGFAGMGVGEGEPVSGRKRWANSSGVTLSPPWSSLSSFTGAHVSRLPSPTGSRTAPKEWFCTVDWATPMRPGFDGECRTSPDHT